jgi:hypothetical protein
MVVPSSYSRSKVGARHGAVAWKAKAHGAAEQFPQSGSSIASARMNRFPPWSDYLGLKTVLLSNGNREFGKIADFAPLTC